MTSPQLANAARIVAELRERLKADFALEDGDEALEDTLEGASDLPEILAAMARQVRENEAFSEAIGRMQKELAARSARFETKAQSLRVQIAWAMSESGMKKLPLPDMTLTMSAGKAPLVIPDETKVPYEFMRTTCAPDKTKVRAFVEHARLRPGSWAYFGNAQPTLTIRKG